MRRRYTTGAELAVDGGAPSFEPELAFEAHCPNRRAPPK
jgi:hypothetical protein